MANITELKNKAAAIKSATVPESVSASQVGGLFEDVIHLAEQAQSMAEFASRLVEEYEKSAGQSIDQSALDAAYAKAAANEARGLAIESNDNLFAIRQEIAAMQNLETTDPALIAKVAANTSSIEVINDVARTEEHTDSYIICDKMGNVVATIDSNGISATDYRILNAGQLVSIENYIKSVTSKDVLTSEDDYFVVTDTSGNIILKVDYQGVHCVNISDKADDVEVIYIDAYASGVTEDVASRVYVGLDSIHRAIQSITDSSEKKQYVVRVHGIFLCDNDSNFNDFASVMNEKSVFAVTNSQDGYITIQGDGIDKTIIHGALPNTLDGNIYQSRTIATINGGHVVVKDLTLWHDNGRYIVHTYGATNGAYHEFSRVKFICPQNSGNATAWTSKCPYGVGFKDGNKLYVHDCMFETEVGMFLCHDNAGMLQPYEVKFENIKIVKKGVNNILINVDEYYSDTKSSIELTNIQGGVGHINLASNYSKYDDDNGVVIKGDIGDKSYITPIKQASVQSQLRISVNDTSAEHIIKFVDCTAKSVYEADNILNVNRHGISAGYGFVYREGGSGYKAWCMGNKAVYYNNAIASALGDCSATNKQLKLNIDGEINTITLNANYSTMTAAQILSNINAKLAALTTPCTADYYSIGMETCIDSTTDNVVEMVNVSSGVIINGYAVKRDSYGVSLCTRNADFFGIALDDAKSGGTLRVLTRGVLNRYAQRYYAMPHGYANEGDRLGIDLNGKLTKDDNGMILAVKAKSNDDSDKCATIIFPV